MDIQIKSTLPYLKRVFSALCVAIAAVSLFAVMPDLAYAQSQQNPALSDSVKLDLASRYLNARQDLVQIWADMQKPQEIPDEAAVDKMVQQMMPNLSRSKEWNPDHPNWVKVKAVFQKQFTQLFSQIAEEQREHKKKLDQKQLDQAFQQAFANQLAADDLNKIVGFYESSAGAKFVKVHAQLFSAYPEAALSLQKKTQQGQKIEMSIPVDAARFKVLFGLFDEPIIYQWNLLDPGPGKNKSGLQAIPMITGMVVRGDFDRLAKIWDELPQETQLEVISYRESPLWKSERAAIIKGMQEYEKLAQLGPIARKLGESMLPSMDKVQGLLPK
jgi:hypothetical protein